jgi:hypothetical protein
VDKLLTITDLDPIRRYLAPSDRPKPNSRYSSIQVNLHFFSILFKFSFIDNQDSLRYQYTPNIPKLRTSSPYDSADLKTKATAVIPSNVERADAL